MIQAINNAFLLFLSFAQSQSKCLLLLNKGSARIWHLAFLRCQLSLPPTLARHGHFLRLEFLRRGLVVSFPLIIEETGSVGREIESRQGTGWQLLIPVWPQMFSNNV
jgi:hypothetical protein